MQFIITNNPDAYTIRNDDHYLELRVYGGSQAVMRTILIPSLENNPSRVFSFLGSDWSYISIRLHNEKQSIVLATVFHPDSFPVVSNQPSCDLILAKTNILYSITVTIHNLKDLIKYLNKHGVYWIKK